MTKASSYVFLDRSPALLPLVHKVSWSPCTPASPVVVLSVWHGQQEMHMCVCVLCACVLPAQQDLQLALVLSPALPPVLLWHQPHPPHRFPGTRQLISVSIPAAGTSWKRATNPTPPSPFPLAAAAALMGSIAAHTHSQEHFRDDSNLTLLFVNTAAHCSGPQRLLPQISRRTRR